MSKVTLRGVTKVYPDGFQAVEKLDLDVHDEEFVVLVGPSGCGKSTTLRMVAGLEEVTGGQIAIDGHVVNEVPAKDRDLAMVFQSYALYPHLNVAKNLAFGLERRRAYKSLVRRALSGSYRKAARAERAGIAAKVAAAADTLGIEPLLGKRPGELSGGQRQRVAVGRALVRDPKAFLFDEPLSNLDAKLRHEMRTELKALHKKMSATMIYVTHDQEEAMTLGDRLVVMKDGVVQQCAPPGQVYGEPANRFVAGFVGTPTMNFLEGRLTTRTGTLAFEIDGHALPLPAELLPLLQPHSEKEVVLGLRPDRLMEGEATLQAVVELIEDLGDRWDVIYRLPSGRRLVGRIVPQPGLVEGGPARLQVDWSRAHFFEATEAGVRLA